MTEGTANVMEYVLGAALATAEALLGRMEENEPRLYDALGGMAYYGGTGEAGLGGGPRLDWVIAGGESGPHAGPVAPDWVRALRDQCQGARTPFFFKQWGAWMPVVDWARAHGDDPLLRIAVCGYDEPGLFPATWERLRWNAVGGYGSQAGGPGRANAHRETVWFSPGCLRPPEQQQLALWSVEGEP